MKAKRKYTDEQILAIVKEGEAGRKVADVCRTHGITEQTYYRWKAKYGGMELSEMQRLKQLEDEFARDFVRAHRSILVAIAHVEALERIGGDEGYALRLRGEAEPLAVSRRQLAELRKRLASH